MDNRKKINGTVICPWKPISFARPRPWSRTGYLKQILAGLTVFALMWGWLLYLALPAGAKTLPRASGSLEKGFRVLDVSDLKTSPEQIVYRGDYIKFDPRGVKEGKSALVLSIPSLAIEKALEYDLDQAPYFKMKKSGKFGFSIDSIPGVLRVVEYTGVNYEAVTAQTAQEVMESFKPLVLDVRTPGEYAAGHLKGAALIPVQQLQARMDELVHLKDDPILVYCATGNRSTVASKILIDRGFTRIFNLRYGISDWTRKRLPVVK